MIVVADTTPLNYLILTDETALLPLLYKQVLLPPAVAAELRDWRAPDQVRAWLASPPPWLRIEQFPPRTRPEVSTPDPGEREAIELALEREVHTVLIDEARARRKALMLGLEAQGTLGILGAAARLGQCDLLDAFRRLEATNFRFSTKLQQAVLRRAGY